MVVHTLIPARGRQRQVDLYEFQANLVYRVSSRIVGAVTQRNPVSKNQKEKKRNRVSSSKQSIPSQKSRGQETEIQNRNVSLSPVPTLWDV